MNTIKVGVREFREHIAAFLESGPPITAVGTVELLVSMSRYAERARRQPSFPNSGPQQTVSLSPRRRFTEENWWPSLERCVDAARTQPAEMIVYKVGWSETDGSRLCYVLEQRNFLGLR